MSKRVLLTLCCGATASVACANEGASLNSDKSSTKAELSKNTPNVLIIMTDEHNFRTLGCYRQTMSRDIAEPWGSGIIVETPNIDKLAQMGVMCTNAYATQPVSSPSRSCFFTGMYPQTTDVIMNDIPMDGTMITFAQTLVDNGYRTAYLGKWHLDGDAKPGWEPERKFGFEDNRYMFNRGHWKNIIEVDGKPTLEGDGTGIDHDDVKGFTTDFLVDKAINFMDDKSDKPFCCVISIPDPHGPNSVRKPYDQMYMDMEFERPISATVSKKDYPVWAKPAKKTIIDRDNYNGMAAYFGMVKCIDDNMGKLISFLESKGELNNTLIVFTSDHGDLLGEHGRDNKGVPYEGSAKVPLIWCYGDKLKSRVIETPMNNVSFAPTLLSLLDIKSDVEYQGIDFANVIESGDNSNSKSEVAIMRSKWWLAACDGEYKLIYSARAGESAVMFNIKDDPNEMVNIYDTANPKVIARLSKALVEYAKTTNEPVNIEKIIGMLNR